jgi:hypothetical protein
MEQGMSMGQKTRSLGLGLAVVWTVWTGGLVRVDALPPPDDTPEEILQTEIITEARSPLDGEPLTAAEYAELIAELEAGPDIRPRLAPELEYTIYLLRLRRVIRSVFPFLLQ